jgi:sodium pump decarboxylase gamma subunit
MELFRETFIIMVIGMSLVFFFLFVVIQCMNLIAFLVQRYEARKASYTSDNSEDGVAQRQLAAAIAVATHSTSDNH